MIRCFFFEDQVYDWGRFRNTLVHTRTKITFKLPPRAPPPPPPRYFQILWGRGTGYLFFYRLPPVNREPAMNADMISRYDQFKRNASFRRFFFEHQPPTLLHENYMLSVRSYIILIDQSIYKSTN